MIRTTIIFALTVMLTVPIAAQDKLSRERQLEIIQHYLLATGQSDALAAFSITAEQITMPELPIKCGTPAVMDFVLNRDKFDADLSKTLGELVEDRPTGLNLTVSSPSGRFLIHYTTTGSDAVYNGFSGYADSVAKIFDEVYAFLIDTLNYPDPPTDEDCPNGGTAAFDVYLPNLVPFVYGYTYPEYDCPASDRTVPAYMVLDNDYYELSQYRDDPLTAVRVTCAHEFFHVVQFGIDITELTLSPDGHYRGYWMEMSATWMEEEKYDHINDYYNYLPYFFSAPETSIQSFINSYDLHPYASMLYPLFLSERYNSGLIRDIWIRCAQLGRNRDDFPAAAQYVIDTFTNGTESFAATFHEFTLWNYFTGSRSSLAPAEIGYEERPNYPKFELGSDIVVENNYADSVVVQGEDNPFNPQSNAAFYLMLDNLQSLEPDTTYWICTDGSFPACSDSTQVSDADDWELMYVDSSFMLGFSLDPGFPQSWGFHIVRYSIDAGVVDVATSTLPAGYNSLLELSFADIDAMVFILSPASSNSELFSYSQPPYTVGYRIGGGNLVPQNTFFAPFPNPAVISELDGADMSFGFQVPPEVGGTDLTMMVDIFTVAGERVRTLSVDTYCGLQCRAQWNFRNDNGEPVASGVYLAYARLFADSEYRQLIAEGRTKVLVVR